MVKPRRGPQRGAPVRSDPRWNRLLQHEPREQKPAAVKFYNKNNNWAIVAPSRGTVLQTAQHVTALLAVGVIQEPSGADWAPWGSKRLWLCLICGCDLFEKKNSTSGRGSVLNV